MTEQRGRRTRADRIDASGSRPLNFYGGVRERSDLPSHPDSRDGTGSVCVSLGMNDFSFEEIREL